MALQQKLEAAESTVSWAGDVIEASEEELRKVGGRLPTVLSVGKGARRGVFWVWAYRVSGGGGIP